MSLNKLFPALPCFTEYSGLGFSLALNFQSWSEVLKIE